MNKHLPLNSFLNGALLLAVLLLHSCGEDSPTEPSPPPPPPPPRDTDGDGVPDSRDDCPSDRGETAYGGCPWYKVDDCSGRSPYKLQGLSWSDRTPAFYYSSSLPSSWRSYVDYAANKWNQVGARIEIRKYSTIVSAGVSRDQRSVVSYGSISGSVLGKTYKWYDSSTGTITEADIKLNSNHPLSTNSSSTTYDVYSVLVHEFGHFCGLGHVDDRTHSMTGGGIPKDCKIYRTLCGGDKAGLRRLYP